MVERKQRNVELLFIALLVDITHPTCHNFFSVKLIRDSGNCLLISDSEGVFEVFI